jgi:hypothetical protein
MDYLLEAGYGIITIVSGTGEKASGEEERETSPFPEPLQIPSEKAQI